MSVFNRVFKREETAIQIFRQIAELNLLDWEICEGGEEARPLFNLRHPEIYNLTHMLLSELYLSKQRTAIVETYLCGKILQNPKVYQPSQLNCEALEQISINITLLDYHQPFPTMVIELPENYSKNRIVPCPQAGQTYYKETLPDKHEPLCAAVHFDEEKKILIVGVYFSSGQVINRFCWYNDKSYTIEEHITAKLRGEYYHDTEIINEEEERVSIEVMRLAINACLMLMEYGCKMKGYENRSYAERLKRYIEKDKKNKDFEKAKRDENELRSLPIYYEMEQVVTVYETEKETFSQDEKGSHNSPKPHWRKGHYLMQAYGPGHSLRKRQLRKPVLVNGHLLGGRGIVTTIYKDK